MTTTIDAREIRVSVNDWRYDRTVLVEEERVLMEIARTSNNCHHCPTCRRRVETVERVLRDSSFVWKWEYLSRGGMWLALARQGHEDPVTLLRRATGLNISY